MNKLLIGIFLTPKKRMLTAIFSLSSIIIASLSVIYYLDHLCDHPALALFALLFWVSLIVGFWWLSLMSLSPQLILPSVLSSWMEENALESSIFSTEPVKSTSERLSELGLELPELDPYDPRQFRVNAESRFRLLFILGVMSCLLLTHFTQDHFLTRFQRVGLTLTYLRSDDSLTRLKGLNLLIDAGRYRLVTESSSGEERVAESLERELLIAITDPHEGVRARAAFVGGLLHLKSAVPLLEEMASTDEVLREVALLALGAMPVTPINPHPAHQALKHLSGIESILSTQPLALSIALGRQRVAAGEQLKLIYQAALPTSSIKSQNSAMTSDRLAIRQASMWALGELRDPSYLSALDDALRDPDISVRCLSALSFEKMVQFESSPFLRRAFERSNKDEQCPQVVAPTQEGVKALVLMDKKSYQLALMRALATTDDPYLLKWFVVNQDDIDPMASRLLYKYYKALEKKEKSGMLDALKRRQQKH